MFSNKIHPLRLCHVNLHAPSMEKSQYLKILFCKKKKKPYYTSLYHQHVELCAIATKWLILLLHQQACAPTSGRKNLSSIRDLSLISIMALCNVIHPWSKSASQIACCILWRCHLCWRRGRSKQSKQCIYSHTSSLFIPDLWELPYESPPPCWLPLGGSGSLSSSEHSID